MTHTNKSVLVIALATVGIGIVLVIFILGIQFMSDKLPNLLISNHSGQSVTIIIHGRSFHHIQPDSSVETPFVDETWTIAIVTSAQTWSYKWFPLNEGGYLSSNRIILQIEPDGKLYVLPYWAIPPVDDLPPQPIGFPLIPTQMADRKNGKR
jgi:hypothetical protein